MRVALVEPPAVVLEMGSEVIGEVVLNFPKYPLLLLAANVREGLNAHVEVIDCKTAAPTVQEYRTISYEGRRIRCLLAGGVPECIAQADIVAITANFTYERPAITHVIHKVRQQNSHLLIVVGGHDATADPAYYLRRGADVCVLGEGETILNEIIERGSGDTFEGLKGIATRQGSGILKSGKQNPHALDAIRYPDEGLLRRYRYNECPDGSVPLGVRQELAVIETSRGCNERCSFCDSSFIVGAFRKVPLQHLRAQISALVRADLRTILFADDNLLYRTLPQYGGEAGRDELLTFFSEIRSAGFAWTFYNGVQFGLLERQGALDTELINTLFGGIRTTQGFAGCFRAYIPFEKFTPAAMFRLPKLRPLSLERILLAAIARTTIPELNIGFIIGTPDESRESIKTTFKEVSSLEALVCEASTGGTIPRFFPWCSVPLPGTPDHSRWKTNIRYSPVDYPELYNNYTSVVVGSEYSPFDFTLMRRDMDIELNRRSNKCLKTLRTSA